MSAIIAPQVQFNPEFLAYCQAALDLNAAQCNAPIAPAIAAAPATPRKKANPATPATPATPLANGDLGFGFKKDGTPRKKANPVWLHKNVAAESAAAAAAPVITAAPATTTRQAIAAQKRAAAAAAIADVPTIAAPAVPTIANEDEAWRILAARNGVTQHIRIVSAELALYGAKSPKLSLDLPAKFTTKGEASDHYKKIAKRAAAKNLDFRNGTTNWKNAAAMIKAYHNA